MSTHAFFFSHWKGKLASLFLAVAIWYLIDTHLRNPERIQFPIPGTNVNPLPDNSPNSVTPIPGGGSPNSSNFPTSPSRIEEEKGANPLLTSSRKSFRVAWIADV